ncbi:MAG: ParB/RepB/Spo0J family partition protein [Gemmatimonadota bacterium]|nr:ParB/RepB/Spo0J family partition protein [Gemmatimonadota bacterium]
MANQDRRLGKGLGALLGENLDFVDSATAEQDVEVSRIRPNPFQPRADFEPTALADLAESISRNGLLQPIVVRDVGEGFQIVAGERRFRAIRQLGWERVPIVTRALSDEQMLVVALVENLQRENLSILEEAQGYQRLVDEFGLTQEDVGRHVGRDRSTVSNALRLLTLPAAVRELISAGRIAGGHARAILALPDAGGQIEMARRVAAEGWSVRETERRVKAGRDGKRARAARPTTGTTDRAAEDPAVRRAELILERVLGTQVRVRVAADGGGELRVAFHDADDFLRILQMVAGDDATSDFQ